MRVPSTAPKILLYSHDTLGLGNIRRALLLAEMLGHHYSAASLLIVTGSPMIRAFTIPARTDYVKLPCLIRSDADRDDPIYPESQQTDVAEMRRAVLQQTILGFAPDLMIVDKRAAGIGGELLAPLRTLRRTGAPSKIVLGIRDILDAPTQARLSLKRAHDMQTIARYYDEVWIYGEQTIFDAVTEYRFPPSVARKTRFCGYLKARTRKVTQHDGPPRVLITTGGGEDGSELIETYLDGLVALPRRVALTTTVVVGPQIAPPSRERLLKRFGGLPDVEFVDFDPDLAGRYAAADLVVSMAGYNTVCELMSWARRAVLVPSSKSVGEQLLRARLLAARGLFDVVEPDDLSPNRLISSVLTALSRPARSAPMDLDGLPRIAQRVGVLLRELAA
jgi:predicted glycosyltransferase